ncbi:MAG: hypothetical protein LBS37_09030 [Treponema sp.]|jgi:hypothetical protein|nr:hypothetical protein [Treponema sp.]
MTATPSDAMRFAVEWTTITAIEIKAAAAIKTPASRTARTASAVLGFFRRLTPPGGFFPAVRGAFFAVFGCTGFAGNCSVFFMQITLKVEPVPKLIDCALVRTVLEQALAVFQAKALQNCVF